MDLKEILFDQYSRYSVCADVLKAILGKPAPHQSIIDVGSGVDCLLASLLPEYSFTFVDPLLKCRTGPKSDRAPFPRAGCTAIAQDILSGSASELGHFTAAVAIDTLEHIPAVTRKAFVENLSSLSKESLILAFPSSAFSWAKEVDQLVDDTYIEGFGSSYSWLAEHREFGLPDHELVVKQLESLGWHVTVFGQGHVPWLKLLLPLTVCMWDIPTLKSEALRLSEAFNRTCAKFDTLAPCYRVVLVAERKRTKKTVYIKCDPNQATVAWESMLREVALCFGRIVGEHLGGRTEIGQAMRENLRAKDKEIVRLQALIQETSHHCQDLFARLTAANDEIGQLKQILEDNKNNPAEKTGTDNV